MDYTFYTFAETFNTLYDDNNFSQRAYQQKLHITDRDFGEIMYQPTITVVQNEHYVISELCKEIERAANEAIKRDNVFTIGLSGGSLATFLSKGLPKISTDWTKWKLFFCDERVVPLDSLDSNYGVYKSALIGTVPVKDDQFIKINPQLSAEEAARDYAEKMAAHFPGPGLPRFDQLLLGMGPDGHTCSLFPGHRLLLAGAGAWVAALDDSPKPPPARVTLTLPVINNARCCVFAAVGQAKADMVKRILKDKDPSLPCSLVSPTQGQVHWILDESAASLINHS